MDYFMILGKGEDHINDTNNNFTLMGELSSGNPDTGFTILTQFPING